MIDYLEQVRVDDVQARRVTSIHNLEETERVAGQPLDDEYEQGQDPGERRESHALTV